MPFAAYRSIVELATAHRITLRTEEFVVPLEREVPAHLRDELAFSQEYFVTEASEVAVGESFIFPILKEVWKTYTRDLRLWSHEPLGFDPDLSGTPDYFLSSMSPLGPYIKEPPYLVIVEAKRDDPARGWGQCLAAMLAAQGLNGIPQHTIYASTTNGRGWEFGKLEAMTCIRDPRLFTLRDLDDLFAALNFVFDQCRRQIPRQPSAA